MAQVVWLVTKARSVEDKRLCLLTEQWLWLNALNNRRDGNIGRKSKWKEAERRIECRGEARSASIADYRAAHFLFCSPNTGHRGSAHRVQEFGRVGGNWESLRHGSIRSARECDSPGRRCGRRRAIPNAEQFSVDQACHALAISH